MEKPRCDRCLDAINVPDDLHYSVTIEIEAEGYIDESEYDSADEKLESLAGLIESADEVCASDFGDEWYQRRQYFLCKNCYAQFIKNPLGKASK
ncbi:MAG: hypothetical protein ACK480_14985 [Planctomycetota bacterium]|nr:hypothetical protein [Planctomycetaceae bacterium]